MTGAALQPTPTLVLRDIHQPPAPGWWPPAPGWWVLAAVLLLVVLVLAMWAWRRRRRRRALARLFDEAVATAESPPARVAVISELLRRAARSVDPHADRLSGEAWLRFLDRGMPAPAFASGPGRLLLDGAFRAEVAPAEVEALRRVGRDRYLQWLGAR